MAHSLRKILVLEDSPMMRQLYKVVLAERADELVYAENGVEGLDRAAQEPEIDLLVVDINMPQMDGLEFLRRLRGELGLTGVPALVVSTEGDERDREAAMAAGADAFLQKPWTPTELLRAIDGLTPTARDE